MPPKAATAVAMAKAAAEREAAESAGLDAAIRENSALEQQQGAAGVAGERTKYFCNFCQAPNPLMACGVCKTKYCSAVCQKKAWPTHKTRCNFFAKDRTYREAQDDIKAKKGPKRERLYNASLSGRYADLLDILDKEGGNADVLAEGGLYLQAAASRGQLRVCELLISRRADLNYVGQFGTRALHVVAQNGFAALAVMFLDNGARVTDLSEDGLSPLHLAAVCENAEVVTALVQHPRGPSVDQLTSDGKTALWLVCDSLVVGRMRAATGYSQIPQCEVVEPIPSFGCKIVSTLIQLNASLETADSKGYTGLTVAATSGEVSVMKLLLDAGANALHLTKEGFMPIHCAASGNRGAAISLLLEHGVPVDVLDKMDEGSALHLAVVKGWPNCVSILLEAGADPHLKSSRGLSPLDIAIVQRKTGIVALIQAKIAERGLGHQ